MQTDVLQVLEFFTILSRTIGYSGINTARAALSALVTLPYGQTLSTHPLINRFCKGVFQLKPPCPRYSSIWDVKIILDYLRRLSPAPKLSLRDLSMKTVVLMSLVSAQRQQTLHMLNIQDMEVTPRSFTFKVKTLLKTSKPGHVGELLKFRAYPPDRRLCVHNYLQEYLRRTLTCRGKEQSLFISFQKPFKSVSKDTIARWIRSVMLCAGIDVELFKPHSVRSAAVSKANQCAIPLDTILAHAGWRSERTFQRYYNKPIQRHDADFANAVLQG